MPLRLCRNAGIKKIVILNEVKNLIISSESIIEILPCLPADRGYCLRMTLRNSLPGKGGGSLGGREGGFHCIVGEW